MRDRGRGASRRSLLTRQSWRKRAPRTSSYSSALCLARPYAWPYCTYSLHLLGPQRKRSLVMGMGNHPSVSPNAPGHGLRTFSNGTPPPTIVPTVGDLVSHGRINMRLRALCAGNKHGTEDINIPSVVCVPIKPVSSGPAAPQPTGGEWKFTVLASSGVHAPKHGRRYYPSLR
jgi:hypothetical protein